MLKTKKLKSYVLVELELLKNAIPSVVLQSLHSYTPIYTQLFGSTHSAYAIYIKNKVALPYSYSSISYNRCRAKYFTTKIYSALDYYFNHISQEEKIEIVEYLKGNLERIPV